MSERENAFTQPRENVQIPQGAPKSGAVEDPSNNFPTEQIELPSGGWFYPPENPLSKGVVDLHYMTAKHEDILTSRTLIQRGVVIDRLLQSLIATPGVNYNDLLLGDKDAITIAARILGYGKNYEVKIECPSCGATVDTVVDLQELDHNKSELIENSPRGRNQFDFTLPVSKNVVTFKLLTVQDEKNIELELERLKKVNRGGVTSEVTTRMRHSIVAVNGESEPLQLRKAIDNMLSRDSLEFRNYVRSISPDIDMSFMFNCPECGYSGVEEVPLGVNFFWPNA